MTNILTWYENTAVHQWFVQNIWKPSWTKLTTFVYGLPAGLLAMGQVADTWLHDSTIAQYMDKLSVPNWVPMGLAGLALFHYVASGHKD